MKFNDGEKERVTKKQKGDGIFHTIPFRKLLYSLCKEASSEFAEDKESRNGPLERQSLGTVMRQFVERTKKCSPPIPGGV